jgi:methionyl-tRNA formyltransferase
MSGGTSVVPGTVERADKHGVFVRTGNGVVELIDVQLEGKKPMAARDWAAGRGITAGQILV